MIRLSKKDLPLTDNAPELTKTIVAAYIATHHVAAADIPEIISVVHRTLTSLDGADVAEPETEPKVPAVSIRASVNPNYLVCFEDGKRFTSLKRHLAAAHNLDPAAYRAKWDLKKSYPMTAPNYSETRATLAKATGLGQRGHTANAALSAAGSSEAKLGATKLSSQSAVQPAPKRRRRPKATPSLG